MGWSSPSLIEFTNPLIASTTNGVTISFCADVKVGNAPRELLLFPFGDLNPPKDGVLSCDLLEVWVELTPEVSPSTC